MVKLRNKVEYTDIEEFEVAQTVNEFADFAGYENGDNIPLQTFLESEDVEDFAKDYFVDYCQEHDFDAEDTAILYSW